jgi:hypothetical protein
VKNYPMVGMTGHQGLPPSTSELVAEALRSKLTVYAPNLVGVTMLGPGADQLFARIVLELGGSVYVVVPAARYRDGFEEQSDREGYDELYARRSYFERLEHTESTERAHMDGGKVVVDRAHVLVAVWDGKPARGLGGTADVVAYARERGVPVEVIWPEGARRD